MIGLIIYLIGFIVAYKLDKAHHLKTYKYLEWNWGSIMMAISLSLFSWISVFIHLFSMIDMNKKPSKRL